MSHDRSHGSCGDESHGHDHHHDDIPEAQGHRDNLFSRIDRDHVVAYNAASPSKGPEVIKPWHERLDEDRCIESDADDQLIIHVPFTGSVKLRALLLKAGPADLTPGRVELYTNVEHPDFSELADRQAIQEFVVPQGREVGEYHLRPAKFSNVTSVTLYFPEAQGADVTRVYYVGFLGQWSERKNAPVVTVYEAQPNLADHEKIQGTHGNFSMPQQ